MAETRTLDTPRATAAVPWLRIERASGQRWLLRAAQRIPVPRERLFPFFADAGNLERITPPGLGFDIVTPRPIAMGEGTLIDYRIRLWAVPLRWRTRIATWQPPYEFLDEQLSGPYAEWRHRHRFTALEDGATLMEDDVLFRLPLGALGDVAAPLVRRELRRIFGYRRSVIAGLAAADAW